MKLSATQKNLAKGLSLVARAVGNAATLPVLANILLETEKGRLRISATDLEIGVITWVGATVEADGSITVPARTLVEFVNNNSDETISFKTDNEKFVALSESFKAEIPGISATEYPSIPSIEKGTSFSLSKDEFLTALSSVVVATAVDEARPALAGVYLKGKGNTINVAATDSFRLAEYMLETDDLSGELEIIIPSRAIHEAVRIMSAEDIDKIQFVASNNQAQITVGDSTIVTRLIEATFPEYTKVIPTDFVSEVVVNTSNIANALRMASIFTTNQANNAHIKIEDQNVRLSSVASQYGQEVSALDAEVMHKTADKNLDIAFNTRYLLDSVNATNGNKIIIKFAGPTSPAVVANPDIPNYQHIVMPIRVSS